ncbi:hypothetical protein ACFLRM_05560 [Acidobacteriota bacterium]
MKKKYLTCLLILSCVMFMWLKLKTDQIPRKKIPGSSIIYIPSGKYLKYVTFGNPALIADIIYLWAIQYFSDQTISDRYLYLDHIFSIIAELDYRYLDPYEVGALIAVYEANDLETGFKILDRGLANNPDQWIFPFQAAHYAQMGQQGYELAQKYYKKAMEIKTAPPLIRRLYADAAFKAMDLKTSWNTWLEIYQTAEDERIKKIASNHLYQVKAAIDAFIIKEALEAYKKKFNRYPENLDQLVLAGLLRSVPKDLDEKDYLYDSKTGEVKPRVSPWKR